MNIMTQHISAAARTATRTVRQSKDNDMASRQISPYRRSRAAALALVSFLLAGLAPAAFAQPASQWSSGRVVDNAAPLAFGMDVQQTASALKTPLIYVRGRPGDEIFMAERHVGGSGLMPRTDRLYLQFRRHRLTGWKGDWGQPWIWSSGAPAAGIWR